MLDYKRASLLQHCTLLFRVILKGNHSLVGQVLISSLCLSQTGGSFCVCVYVCVLWSMTELCVVANPGLLGAFVVHVEQMMLGVMEVGVRAGRWGRGWLGCGVGRWVSCQLACPWASPPCRCGLWATVAAVAL